MVMDFLTSRLRVVPADQHRGPLYMERVAFETDMQVDFTTDNLLVKGYERY
jgi:hypothetical protein